MTDKDFFNKSLMLSFEFSRYLIGHPEMEDQIPKDALIVFLLEDDPDFNKQAIQLAKSKRETGQPVVIVRVQQLLPPTESRLVNPKLELVSSL